MLASNPQALYYWSSTYFRERHGDADKSELGKLARAEQRMQQNVSGTTTTGSISLADASARVQSHGGVALTSYGQVIQGIHVVRLAVAISK